MTFYFFFFFFFFWRLTFHVHNHAKQMIQMDHLSHIESKLKSEFQFLYLHFILLPQFQSFAHR